jgi:hypothetical protein
MIPRDVSRTGTKLQVTFRRVEGANAPKFEAPFVPREIVWSGNSVTYAWEFDDEASAVELQAAVTALRITS